MADKILIIDDEPSILFAMSEYFMTRGFEVDCAGNKQDAKACLAKAQYAVIIADLRLSGSDEMEGLELIACAHKHYPRTRKILLTAYGSSRVEGQAFALGANAFLHKPKPLAEVWRVVSDLLRAGPAGASSSA